MKSKKWIHPIHGKGYKSPQFDGALGPLTDKKIDEYIMRGHYGDEARVALIARKKLNKKKLTAMEIALSLIKLLSGKK
jgi:hypothetical protein